MIERRQMFVPSLENLYFIQENGGNVYKYLICKTIEKIVLDGINYPGIGMLEMYGGSFSDFREDSNIAKAVCRMYPEEIKYSKTMQYEPDLCLKLISEPPQEDNSLNNLTYFNQTILNNTVVINQVIKRLSKILLVNPKYRFTYKSNSLLNDILLCKLDLDNAYLYGNNDNTILGIEPAYLIKNPDYYRNNHIKLSKALNAGIDTYGLRYDLPLEFASEYKGKDILTYQPHKVKKLIKCINNEL